MAPRNRALFALVGLISALAAGCSGGKTGTTPPTSTPSPTPSPTGGATTGPTTGPTGIDGSATSTPFVLKTATPVPAATAVPTGLVNSVGSRPLANGDVFHYSGTTTQSFVYEGYSPSPSSTNVTSVSQTVTVSTGKSYNGATGLDDFVTAETDAGINQTTTSTTNSYYALTDGPTDSTTEIGQQALTNYGYTSTDNLGDSIGVLLTNPGYNMSSPAQSNGLVDLVPEERTPTWTNTQAQTFSQTESDGFSATRTYAADGSYVENDVYPQSSAASPAPTPMTLTATITEKPNGSGVYDLPLFGPPNLTINFAAPTSNGTIVITFDDDTGALLDTEQSSAWFPSPLALYTEIDRDNGAVAYPSACNVPSTYGTSGNEVEQKYTRVDTILGTLEFFDQLTYVSSNGTAACVQLKDTTYIYYDYSGQSNPDSGVGVSGGNSPFETQTVTTTLGVSSNETINSTGRTNATASRIAGASMVANARANFLHTVDHYRALRERKMSTHLRAHFARLHRK